MYFAAYNQLFRELATTHKRILATPKNGRFMRIFISADPVQKQLDITEFYGKLRSGLQARAGQPFLVAENYQADYSDNQGDYFARKLDGAFLVLQWVKIDDYDARDLAIEDCEKIAENLLAAVVVRLRAEHQADISVGEAWAEHIGPIADGHVGVRLNFTWSEPAGQELVYNPDNFTE